MNEKTALSVSQVNRNVLEELYESIGKYISMVDTGLGSLDDDAKKLQFAIIRELIKDQPQIFTRVFVTRVNRLLTDINEYGARSPEDYERVLMTTLTDTQKLRLKITDKLSNPVHSHRVRRQLEMILESIETDTTGYASAFYGGVLGAVLNGQYKADGDFVAVVPSDFRTKRMREAIRSRTTVFHLNTVLPPTSSEPDVVEAELIP